MKVLIIVMVLIFVSCDFYSAKDRKEIQTGIDFQDGFLCAYFLIKYGLAEETNETNSYNKLIDTVKKGQKYIFKNVSATNAIYQNCFTFERAVRELTIGRTDDK